MSFYELRAKQGRQYYQGNPAPWPKDLAEVFLGPSVPRDLHIAIRVGVKPGDLIFGAPCIVSRRLLGVLVSCQATGYEAFPVDVRKGDIIIPDYFGLRILGRGGPLDEVRSGVFRGPGSTIIFGYSAVYMDEDRWDGSDIFVIPSLGVQLFISERVQKAIQNAGLVNLETVLNSECMFGAPAVKSWRENRERK